MQLSRPGRPQTIDPSRCPICGQDNRCAMTTRGTQDPPCWCTGQTFSRALLESIPPHLRDKACICPACAAASQAEQQ